MAETPKCSGCAVGKASAGVSRRDFVTLATLSAVTVALSACGGGAEAGVSGPQVPGVPAPGPNVGPPGTGSATVKLSDFPALNVVGGVAKVVSTPPVAVARTDASTYVAFSMACTHQGTTVNINANGSILCPNHGAQYTSAGIWSGGFPATSLVRLPVVVDASGNATITI